MMLRMFVFPFCLNVVVWWANRSKSNIVYSSRDSISGRMRGHCGRAVVSPPQDTACSSGLGCGGSNSKLGGVNSLGKNFTPTALILGLVGVVVTDQVVIVSRKTVRSLLESSSKPYSLFFLISGRRRQNQIQIGTDIHPSMQYNTAVHHAIQHGCSPCNTTRLFTMQYNTAVHLFGINLCTFVFKSICPTGQNLQHGYYNTYASQLNVARLRI